MTKITMILFGVFFLLGSAQGQNLYKWVDDQGNVFYQDQPPEGAEENIEAYGEIQNSLPMLKKILVQSPRRAFQ